MNAYFGGEQTKGKTNVHTKLEQMFGKRISDKGYAPYTAVSYTHLDVYKRQVLQWLTNTVVTFEFPINTIIM